MKTEFLLAVLLSGLLAFMPARVSAADKAEGASPQSVTLKKGVVLVMVDGQQTEATNEVTLRKDIVVNTNGLFKVAGGKERPLAEGQILGQDGTLTSPDGSIVPVDDHLTAKRGRVILVKDGEAKPLGSVMTLKNGTRVYPDGRMVTTRNLISRLLDGQIVKLNDSLVESTDTARLEKGRVVLFKDGGRLELKPGQVMVMSEGSHINGAGVVTKPDGTMVKLKEGELYKFAGAGDGLKVR